MDAGALDEDRRHRAVGKHRGLRKAETLRIPPGTGDEIDQQVLRDIGQHQAGQDFVDVELAPEEGHDGRRRRAANHPRQQGSRIEQRARQIGKRQRETAGEDRADGELALRADVPDRGPIAQRESPPHHDQRRRLDGKGGKAAGLDKRRDEETLKTAGPGAARAPRRRPPCRGSSARSPAPARRRSKKKRLRRAVRTSSAYACPPRRPRRP